nr:hypothetical protein BaRGS_028107 [Batillaria attramentaria]
MYTDIKDFGNYTIFAESVQGLLTLRLKLLRPGTLPASSWLDPGEKNDIDLADIPNSSLYMYVSITDGV